MAGSWEYQQLLNYMRARFAALTAGGGPISSTDITDSTATGRAVLTAATTTAARTAIGAGTSSLALGTTNTTAKAGDYQPTAANISDSTATGRSVLTAASSAAARSAIGAGTSDLAIGTTSATAKAGDYQPTAANISDSTATGRSVLTATDAAAARTAIGAGTSSLALGTSSSTAKAGDYQPTAANISDSTATGRAVVTAVDAAAARTAIGAGTSSLALGTSSSTAKAGDYQPASTNISDSTVTGRALIVATDAAAARTASGAAAAARLVSAGTGLTGGGDLTADRTLTVAYGSTSTTACVGNDSRLSDARTPTAHTHPASDLTATGISSSKFLRGDNTWANAGLGVTLVTNLCPGCVAASSKSFAATNTQYWVPVAVRGDATFTGIRFRKGTGTTSVSMIGSLYDASGNRVAVSATTASGAVASAVVSLPFTPGSYAATSGIYWASILGSATGGDFFGWAVGEYLGPATNAAQGSTAAAGSFSPPALTSLGSVVAPFIQLY